MTISRAFRVATAACAVSLAVALLAAAFSSALTVPASILTALAGVAPLVVFVVGTMARGTTWDDEADAARLIEEIMSPTADHTAPGSLSERPRTEVREKRESPASEPSSWDILAWPVAGAHDLELDTSK